MKEKLRQFMTGRYGADEFSRYLLYFMIGLMVLNMLVRSSLLNLLLFAAIAYLYFRMFSKNHPKRYQENVKFLQSKDRFLSFFRKGKIIAEQKKIYRIYTCPGCKQKIRVPKGKGKIEVTCPKCSTSFVKKS